MPMRNTTSIRFESAPSPVNRIRGAGGFTLVELMVALTIGLIIIVAVGRIFISTRTTHQTDTGLARVQENARFAMDFVQREIRMAGYLGCLGDVTKLVNNLNSPTTDAYRFGVGLEGHEANTTGPGASAYAIAANPDPATASTGDWTPALPAAVANQVMPGTDVVVVRRMSDTLIPLQNNGSDEYHDAAGVFVANTADANALAQGDILILTDCGQGTVFQVATNPSSGGNPWLTVSHAVGGGGSLIPGNACNNWTGPPQCPSQTYTNGGELAKGITTYFYIGRGAGPAGTNNPALYRAVLDKGAWVRQELVSDVENMQVLYGYDTDTPRDNYANRYVPAAAGLDWTRVVSVRIGLLIRTPESSGPETDTRNYVLAAGTSTAGVEINPNNDNRRRRVFTTTIQLRNRLDTGT